MKLTTVLGLDFGERRIGIAVSDPHRLIATGHSTLDRRQNPDVFKALARIIEEEDVGQIVVGYPLRTDGKQVPGGKTEIVDAFIASLEARFGLPVDREDEAFTTSLAQDSLKLRSNGKMRPGSKHQREKDKAAIDRVAACYILQDWLNRQEKKT